MTRTLLALCACAVLGAADAVPAPAADAPLPKDAASEESVIELLTLEHRMGWGQRWVASSLERMVKQRNLPRDEAALKSTAETLGKEIDDDARKVMVPIARHELDQATVDASLAFYRSDAGKRWIEARERIQDRANEAQNGFWGRIWPRIESTYRDALTKQDEQAGKDAEAKQKKDGF